MEIRTHEDKEILYVLKMDFRDVYEQIIEYLDEQDNL